MTFGEHLEELRTHLISAIKGLAFCLVIGFVLDAWGTVIGPAWLGVGKPMMQVITAPVRQELKAFYDRRMARLEKERDSGNVAALAVAEPKPVVLRIPPSALAAIRGSKELPAEAIDVEVKLDPLQAYKATQSVTEVIRPPELSTLSVTEGMVVYIKVSLLCGLVMASPWVFWQLWSFVAAGMYPNEKSYVYRYLPLSLGLFLGGILLCQFAVIPQSIEALLWFNDWIGFNPDLRLSEWLSFAILLPLVFGVSFQTPLVMLFLERIGIMTVAGYLGAWRLAAFLLAIFAAFITPTPDAITMLAMWLPLMGLYFLGILMCKWASRGDAIDDEVSEPDELVEA
ncbi:MAG: twin-arginine translocase subunit TatC [Gemmataceae bacterium]|nr:twin-arginine translocase subunit TatC [Gemmataceae bacterium]